MKKKVLFLLAFLAQIVYAQNDYWTDEGNYDTSWYDGNESEFSISTAQQLAGIAYLSNQQNITFADKSIRIENDINLSAHYWKPILIFQGQLDGNGKAIDGMVMKKDMYQEGSNEYGFVYFLRGGSISNLTIGPNCQLQTENISIGVFAYKMAEEALIYKCTNRADCETNFDAGGIVRNMDTGCKIEACTNYGHIQASAGGGIAVGNQGIITGCDNYGALNCHGSAAGIATNCSSIGAKTVECNNYADIQTDGVGHIYVYAGGIIASATSHLIESCLNEGNVSGPSCGGIAGHADGDGWTRKFTEIINCTNKGEISGFQHQGCAAGIIGEGNDLLVIDRCANYGNILAEELIQNSNECHRFSMIYTGGILGKNGYIINCYNKGHVKTHCYYSSINCNASAEVTTGGLASYPSAIYNSLNEGKVESIATAIVKQENQYSHATLSTGGLAGTITQSSIFNCYHRGELDFGYESEAISGEYFELWTIHAGGIVGCAGTWFETNNSYYTDSPGCRTYHSWWHHPGNVEGTDTSIDGGATGYIDKDEAKTIEFIKNLNGGRKNLEKEGKTFVALEWEQAPDGYPRLKFNFLTGITSGTEAESHEPTFRLKEGNLLFANTEGKLCKIEIYSVTGIKLYSTKTQGNSVQLPDIEGLAIVKLTMDRKEYAQKILFH